MLRRACLQAVVRRTAVPVVFQRRSVYTWPEGSTFNQKRDHVNRLFAEAMEELGSAREVIGTTYFPEEYDIATEAVTEVMEAYNDLITEGDEGNRVKGEMGLKMEQLKDDLETLAEEE